MEIMTKDGFDKMLININSLDSITRINLPCYIKDRKSNNNTNDDRNNNDNRNIIIDERDLDMLGGKKIVYEALDDQSLTNTTIQYRFPSSTSSSSTSTSSLHNHDITKTNLQSTLKIKNGLLLKLRRNKHTQQIISINIIGNVQKSYEFNSIADYQFISNRMNSDDFDRMNSNNNNSSHNYSNNSVLDCRPGSFCRDGINKVHYLNIHDNIRKAIASGSSNSGSNTTTIKTDEVYIDNYNNNEDNDIVVAFNSNNDNYVHNNNNNNNNNNSGSSTRYADNAVPCIITIDDEIPLQHPLGLYPNKWLRESALRGTTNNFNTSTSSNTSEHDNSDYNLINNHYFNLHHHQQQDDINYFNSHKIHHRGINFIKILNKLFSYIPILSREQIEIILNLQGKVHLFRTCLPYVAYCYSNGPFRKLWIRFNYDPKLNQSSVIYQIISCRISNEAIKDVNDKIIRRFGSIGQDKKVDLDKLVIEELPMNSVNYLIVNRRSDDPAIFIYTHMLKNQINMQVGGIL